MNLTDSWLKYLDGESPIEVMYRYKTTHIHNTLGRTSIPRVGFESRFQCSRDRYQCTPFTVQPLCSTSTFSEFDYSYALYISYSSQEKYFCVTRKCLIWRKIFFDFGIEAFGFLSRNLVIAAFSFKRGLDGT
jgi:hypothetical protein